MAYLVVTINMVTSVDENYFGVTYNWTACPAQADQATSGYGESQFVTSTLSAVVNSAVIDACVAQAEIQGVTIGLLDRKILAGGLN